MKKEVQVISLLAFVAVLGIFAGVNGIHLFKHPGDTQQVLPASDKRVISAAPTEQTAQPPHIRNTVNYPYTLKISSIGVNARVEGVGQTSSGAMAVPQNADNAGWYDLGTKIGEKGSAVIAAHYDKVDGSPSVFWNLKKISEGDSIEVTDTNGKTFTYKVVRVTSYPDASFPISEVFGSSDKAKLNLITCGGTWDKTAHNYDKRTVVYSELEE